MVGAWSNWQQFICDQEAENKECLGLSCFFLYVQFSTPEYGMEPPAFKVGFSTTINLI